MFHPSADSPTSCSTDDVVARFLDDRLEAREWTHTAHLLVARHLLASAPVDDVVADLRDRISAHNARVGLLPYHGGYHETVTRYFVEAVDVNGRGSVAQLLRSADCQREAPLRHWSTDRLRSDEARTSWIDPDLAPLRWRNGG